MDCLPPKCLLSGVLVCLALGLVSCVRDPIVARVGSREIRRSDVVLRAKVIEFYSPGQGSVERGEEQLKRAFTYAEILKAHGREVTNEILGKEADRIKHATLMPEALARLRAIFERDESSYLRLYVLPVYVERVIYYELFLHDPSIQSASKSEAERFRDQAMRDPVHFENIAKRLDKSAVDFHLSLRDGLVPANLSAKIGRSDSSQPTSQPPQQLRAKLEARGQQELSEEGRRWRDELLKGMAVGDVCAKIIDREQNWMVMRYLGPIAGTPEIYRLSVVLFPKADYSQWLAAEVKKISGQPAM